MDYIKQSMTLPVDNLVGMLLYAIIFMLVAGLVVSIALRFIPNRIPYALKSAIVGISVFISLILWWNIIIS